MRTDYEFFRDVIKRPCWPNPDGSVNRICPVSIIIMACNEGAEVENTIVSIINSCNDRHEIIVVDDASCDASFTNLVERVRKRVYKHWRDFLESRIKIITHEKQLGTAQSRRDAIAASSGEVLVFFDAHMRVPSLYGIESMACHALNKQCVLVPQIAGLNVAKELKSRRTYGARFKVTRKWGLLNSHINQAPTERFVQRDSIIGACYVLPTTVLDRLGGWPNLPGQWAYNEQQVGIRCFLYDVPIYYDSGVVVEHMYKKTFNYPLDHSGVVLNGHRTFALHFPESYPTFWEPLIREHGNYPDIINAYLASDVFKKEAAHLAATREHTEQEFFEKMLGITEWPVSPERWLQ